MSIPIFPWRFVKEQVLQLSTLAHLLAVCLGIKQWTFSFIFRSRFKSLPRQMHMDPTCYKQLVPKKLVTNFKLQVCLDKVKTSDPVWPLK